MDRAAIIDEIRRAAATNGGIAPGQRQFEKLSGIASGQWRGKFWVRWSEALTEAGFEPNRLTEAIPREQILGCLAELTRRYGRFPTHAEVLIERERDKAFPHHTVFARIGKQHERISALREFASARPKFADILALLPEWSPSVESLPTASTAMSGEGYVYMLKLGQHYKVGKTFSVPRRHREIALELPEKPDVIHAIRTDDPTGIEAYWHRRFAEKRTNGEWFALNAEDVKAFRLRKFM
jgi:hypothetical protein